MVAPKLIKHPLEGFQAIENGIVDAAELAVKINSEVILPKSEPRRVCFVPQPNVIAGVNEALYIDWNNEKDKETPFIYFL